MGGRREDWIPEELAIEKYCGLTETGSYLNGMQTIMRREIRLVELDEAAEPGTGAGRLLGAIDKHSHVLNSCITVCIDGLPFDVEDLVGRKWDRHLIRRDSDAINLRDGHRLIGTKSIGSEKQYQEQRGQHEPESWQSGSWNHGSSFRRGCCSPSWNHRDAGVVSELVARLDRSTSRSPHLQAPPSPFEGWKHPTFWLWVRQGT